MKKKTIIILPPQPRYLFLAGLLRGHWDNLLVSGKKSILKILENISKDGDPGNLILLLPKVDFSANLQSKFRSFLKAGSRVWWFCEEASHGVKALCRDLKEVILIADPNPFLAIPGELGGPCTAVPSVQDFFRNNPDINDFLRWKISLSYIMNWSPEPLIDGCGRFRDFPRRKFQAKDLPEREYSSLEHFREADCPFIDGMSKKVQFLRERIQKIGKTDLNTMILGETGTGKESVAFFLHELSDRAGKPFLALNCAGLSSQLLQSELFGHVKGAFTDAFKNKTGLIEKANGGTVFLDEIGEMTSPVQAQLLRFIQSRRFLQVGGETEKKADVRLISATQPSLKEKISNMTFRSDLFFRLAKVTVQTPKLTDIPEDIPRIIAGLVYRLAEKTGDFRKPSKLIQYFTNGEKSLRGHSWPGNVRELAGLVERKWYLDDDVLSELKDQADALELADTYSAASFSDPSDIIPVEKVISRYIKSARDRFSDLTQQELSRKLGKALNTIKKYL